MSAPTPAPGDESPSEGYYPDPSIPGYVRYWNGASWVPGTSRPAPPQSTPPPAPRQAPVPDPAPRPPAAGADETGPVYFDEAEAAAGTDGPPVTGTGGPDAPGRPRPATAWQADTSRQTGFGGDRDHRVSWGGPAPAQAQAPAPAQAQAPAPAQTQAPAPAQTQAPAPVPAQAPVPDPAATTSPPVPADRSATAPDPARGALPGMRDGSGQDADAAPARADGMTTIRATQPAAARQPSAPVPAPSPPVHPTTPQDPRAPRPPQFPRSQAPGLGTPLAPGPGGGPAPWAQQAHPPAWPGQAAGPQPPRTAQPNPLPPSQQGVPPGQHPVVPWKSPVDDPFQRLARAQAAARPAGLGRRLAARLVDTVVLGVLVGAVALPLVTRAVEHIVRKIEAAERSGETVTVWLLDSTTAGLSGGVLGAFLVLGFLLEALPTAKWGRTLGKRLCGLEVRDIESHGPPSLGAALRRWLVYGVLGLVVVGVVNVLWCLVDRPWRQCWHDKAARTFVAG